LIDLELKEIIEGCYKGSRKYQEALYNRYVSKMYGICLSYAKNREEAQDILHDGFIKVYKKFNKFDQTQNIETWIRTVVVNTAIDHLRRAKKFREVGIDEQTVPIAHADDNVSETFKTKDLVEIINMLPTGAKTIFNLYTLEGYNHREIAQKLEISVGTSKSQFSRAKQLLQGLVNNYYVKG